MGQEGRPEIGSIGWIDLTVRDCAAVRDFYREVVGWTTQDVDMGEYSDYTMTTPESGSGVAGVCHARGGNREMPPHWLIYITVADADAAAARCTELGGRVIVEPREMGGHGRYCVIEDPAGAVAALFAPKG